MAKAVREASGKVILAKTLEKLSRENGVGNDLRFPVKSVTATPKTDFFQLANENPWLKSEVRNQYKVGRAVNKNIELSLLL